MPDIPIAKTIRITAPVPGPKSAALLERRARAVMGGVSTLHPISDEELNEGLAVVERALRAVV